MRLKTIKLAGFKSFVDATTLHLPSNLIGVVGPNGCGKSNIIDAVRWVMGESSAKHLRGDLMSDVIFNGSSARKPVGTATVELIFDNSDGQIGGEYAGYAEISVKRQVGREGQSLYFLNGARCRRRDITDIFLGTGLGPRSYSIIEQGMISRVVEARPEEIRVYLEEAAGISKYKERRRETENRIRHTRENLARLEDLRSEVDKQLERLKRQAKQADRYKKLKAAHRQKSAELLALKWRDLDAAMESSQQELKARSNALESEIAALRKVEAEIEAARSDHQAAADASNEVQGELYEVGAEIARLEQSIAHRKELQARQRKQHEEIEQSLQELRSHLGLDEAHLEQLNQAVKDGDPALEKARADEAAMAKAYAEAEEAVSGWQAEWDRFSNERGDASRRVDVEQTRIEGFDRALGERGGRIKALRDEAGGLDASEAEASVRSLEQEREKAAKKLAELEQSVDALRGETSGLRDTNRKDAAELNELRGKHQQLSGRLSSLEALQQAAMGEDAEVIERWLKESGIDNPQRLSQVIEVEGGYEAAVEAALGDYLEALVVADPWGLASNGDRPNVKLTLVSDEPGKPAKAGLAARVKGPAAVAELLEGWDVAASETSRPEEPGSRQVFADGSVAGRHWLRMAGDSPTTGVLAREKEIAELRKELADVSRRGQETRERLEQGEAKLGKLEEQVEQRQTELNMQLRRIAELDGQIQSRKARVEAVRQRAERINAEIEGLENSVADDEQNMRSARQRLEGEINRMAELEKQREALESRRRELFEARDAARAKAREAREAAQKLAVELESKRSALRSTENSLERTRSQLSQLETRRKELLEQVAEADSPMDEEQGRLKTLLDQRLEVEQRLAEARRKVDEVADRLRQLDRRRHEIDDQVTTRREKVEAARLELEGVRVKAEGIREQLEQDEQDPKTLLESLAEEEDAGVDSWQSQLERLDNQIRRLEPVNLAAIEEYAEEQERKEYLDAQNEDLTKALETLEAAIRKIDRQTRTRFKETFDKVNTGMQGLYPRLFGGGHAFLELTGDDLLEAGVAIMARPPGKRISNIHLLSGGEKALTAVSFVFSIFQLNPAPFCMLDEVDAPLDDANVGRFSELVKEMSEQVQFLVVTHNKITMEIAHQMMGVTMREPGVSRLVSVDVAEAERLAAS